MEYDLAYLTSRPLIRLSKVNGQTHTQPIEELDFDAERDLLHSALFESGKSVRVRAEVATVTNLRTLVTLGCKALHYSGHGFAKSLAFEDQKGQMHSVDDETLCDLVGAGESSKTKLKFVFVSACYSEDTGKAFARAGVPHVVAVRFDNAVSDVASRVFFQQFYLALLVGKTVKSAFDIGKAVVRSDSRVGQSREADIFLLLPKDGDHNVVIFDDLSEGKWSYVSPREPVLTRIHARPEHFLGRECETQVVFSSLIDKRMVTVYGPEGIGKTALVKNVAQFAVERADSLSLEGVFNIQLEKDILQQEYATSLGAICWFAMHSRDTEFRECRTNRHFYDEMHDRKFLIILDGLDKLGSDLPMSDDLNVAKFLKNLIERCRNIKVLATSNAPSGVVGEKTIPLGKLSRLLSAKLFLKMKPRNLTHDDYAEIDPHRSKLEGLAHHRLLVWCDGNPGKIAEAAWCLQPSRRLGEVYTIMKQKSQGQHQAGERKHQHEPVMKDSADQFWFHNLSRDADTAPWEHLKTKLNKYFEEKTGAKRRPLSNEDFRSIQMTLRVERGTVFKQFFATFWPWFQEFTRIITKIEPLWSNGTVFGLIPKDEAHRLLMKEDEGAFLIRFSESRGGHIALAYRDMQDVIHTVIDARESGFVIEVEDSERLRYESLPYVIYNLTPLKKVVTQSLEYINKEKLVNSRRETGFWRY